MTQLQLGDELKDVVTGKTGVAVSKEYSINGCVRFGLCLESASTDTPKYYYADADALEVVTKQKVKARLDRDKHVIDFGDYVECLISGYKGIVTGRTEYLFRCDRISVQGKYTKEHKADEAYEIDAKVLRILKKNAAKLEKKTSEPQKLAGCSTASRKEV